MKKYWKLFPLWVLIFILLAGCGAKPDAAQQQPDPAEDTAPPEVNALVCSSGSMTLRFARDEEGAWYWSDDPSFPLDDGEILSAIDALAAMTGQAVSPDALAGYGLADPEQYVAVTVGDETTTYYVGKKLESGHIYCNDQEDIRTVFSVPAAVTSLMGRSIYDLARLPEFPGLTADNIHAVEIAHGERTVSLTVSEGKWLSGGKDVTSQVTGLADALGRLSFARCVDYAPSKGAASICGFSKPAAVMTVTYGNSVGTESETVLTIGGTYQDGRFALLDDDTTIYQLSTALAEPILALANNGI